MPAVISLLEHLPTLNEINSFCLEYIECFVDQLFYRFEAYKNQFLLELRIMEAIEHDYFEDMSNVELIEPIYCYKGYQQSDFIMPAMLANNPSRNHQDHEQPDADTSNVQQSNPNCSYKDCDANKNSKGNNTSNEEDMEQRLVELLASLNFKSSNEDNSEVMMLSELLSALDMKGPAEEGEVKEDEPLKDNLDVGEMVAVLNKLSLRDNSLDAFDRDLAVFDSDGNIIVQDTSVFAFLAKVVLNKDSEESKIVRRLLFSEQTV